MLKRRILLVFAFIFFMSFICFIYYKKYNEPVGWNYEGQGVVLADNPPYEFVGVTNLKLDGEVYGFGKYFFGDLQLEWFGDFFPDFRNQYDKIATIYHYNLDTKGRKYLEENRKYIADPIVPATKNGEKIKGMNMMRLDWYGWEYSDTETIKRDDFATAYVYFEKAGESPFVFWISPNILGRRPEGSVSRYLVVPGASTREEALSLLKEHFNFWGQGNFEQAGE